MALHHRASDSGDVPVGQGWRGRLTTLGRLACSRGSLALFFLLPWQALAVRGQPADVKDTLYIRTLAGKSAFSFDIYWLKPDGTFDLLSDDARSSTASYLGLSWIPSRGIGATGTYSYRVGDTTPRSALLKLGDGADVLHFFSEGSNSSGNTFPQEGFRLWRRDTTSPQRNTSNRAVISAENSAITGFVLEKPQWVLVRVVGQSLRKFGVAKTAENPRMRLYSGSTLLHEISGWDFGGTGSAQHEALCALLGAFPLERGSTDCALLKLYPPGAYTVVAGMAEGSVGGDVLTEVYFLPFLLP